MVSTEIYRDWRNVPKKAQQCATAIGNFDGVHRGHAYLIESVRAARPDLPLGVVTFEPHPREIFRPQDPPFRLTLSHEKFRALQSCGVDFVFEVPFNRELANMSATDFVKDVLHSSLAIAHIGCGYDFAFGHRRGGDANLLCEVGGQLDMGVSVVQPLADTCGPLSSSRIRRLLQDGYPQQASEELGRLWCIRGIVQHGDSRGRQLGFPTANVALGRHLEPARGVYAVSVDCGDGVRRIGVANVGRRPTIGEGLVSRLEVHIFDFDGELYNKEIAVSFHYFLREEKRFNGLDELKKHISQDAQHAKTLMQKK